MSAMQMGDYGKDAPRGGGIRLRVLYDAIVNRELIDVEISGGKALIMTSDDVLADMKSVIDGGLLFDSPDKSHANNFVSKYTRKSVLQAIQKVGSKNKLTDITFTKITKTEQFGSNKGSGGGADATALFEGAACWVTAYRYSLNTDIDVDYIIPIDELEAVSGSVSTDEPLSKIHQFLVEDPAWMKSSIRTANKLYSATKYRNNNFKFYRGTGVVNVVEKHFFKVNKEEGRPFSQINKWTPADIYMCECDFDMGIYTKEMTFQGGVNKVLLDLINEKKLIGVSLKKVTGNTANLTEHNFTRASLTVKKPFVKVGSKTLYNSMDVYLEGQGVSVQYRATDREGKTWQGEVMGSAAKHGKVGGGVMNNIMEAVYGPDNGVWRDYASASDVALAAKGPGLDQKILTLANNNSQYVLGDGEVVDIEFISAMRPQWKFAKYLGLLVVDQLMKGSKDQRDEITTRIYLYATSASDDSAPYIKIS
jgi:hypothetical protein|tara:strand:- start:1913 stop:3346 length:1434 start_codon:yes stop_codon:yes gene_type:complete